MLDISCASILQSKPVNPNYLDWLGVFHILLVFYYYTVNQVESIPNTLCILLHLFIHKLQEKVNLNSILNNSEVKSNTDNFANFVYKPHGHVHTGNLD